MSLGPSCRFSVKRCTCVFGAAGSMSYRQRLVSFTTSSLGEARLQRIERIRHSIAAAEEDHGLAIDLVKLGADQVAWKMFGPTCSSSRARYLPVRLSTTIKLGALRVVRMRRCVLSTPVPVFRYKLIAVNQ